MSPAHRCFQRQGLHVGQSELRRRGNNHVHPGDSAKAQQRAGHVVAVPDVGEPQALESPEALAQRDQVGERLAGVVLAREHVDDRDRRVLRQCVDRFLVGGAGGDRVDHAREHQRGVTWRLAPRELQLALAQHQRVAAQLVDPGLERDPRACGGQVEQEHDALARECARGEPIGLELDRAVDEPLELVRPKLRAG